MSLAVVLGFQDAPFPLPAAARFVEPEELKLQHPMVCMHQALPFVSSKRTFCAWQQCTSLQTSPLPYMPLCVPDETACLNVIAEKVKVWQPKHEIPPLDGYAA